jgi:hypothetical protein
MWSGLLREHRSLEDCVRDLVPTPASVLAAGRTLLAFARQEDEAFAALARLLEPAVINEMRAEHEEISQDLDLLAWLVSTTPDSLDASVLAESLARRMHRHVNRDGRLLARVAGLRPR